MSKKSKPRIRLFKILLLVLITAVFAGIVFLQVTRNAIKEDLLGKQHSCSLPCWNNITPGKTNSHDAVKTLQGTAYIDKDSIKQSGTNELGGCVWNWKIPGRRSLPNLSWQNGVVHEISLALTFTLTVEEVISEFGTPEAVSGIEGGTPENWYWIIDMYYPTSGIQVKIFTQNFISVIEPSTEVGGIILFSPVTLETRISELYSGSSSGNMNWIYQPWKGYGDIKQLYTGSEK